MERHVRSQHSSNENKQDSTNSQTSGASNPTTGSESQQGTSQDASGSTFGCRICSQRFESASKLRVHVVSSHKDPETNEPTAKSEMGPEVKDPNSFCFVCNHQFPTRANLNRHNIRKHIDGAKFSCPEVGCNRQFKIEYDLVRHRRNVHGLQS